MHFPFIFFCLTWYFFHPYFKAISWQVNPGNKYFCWVWSVNYQIYWHTDTARSSCHAKFITCNSSTSEQEEPTIFDLCGNAHVLTLQSCNSILSSAGRVWSNQSLQTRLSTAVCAREGRELFLWEWSSSGKMPRLAHPRVKHIAGITRRCCLQVRLLLVSAILALLEEAQQDDGKTCTSLLSESSSPHPLDTGSSTTIVGWSCSPGLEHHLTLFLIMVFLSGK